MAGKQDNASTGVVGNVINWIDDRIPMTRVWNMHIAQYPAPKKL
jgi:ubiquinol-cytochrome c reductase cytochrome b subunit